MTVRRRRSIVQSDSRSSDGPRPIVARQTQFDDERRVSLVDRQISVAANATVDQRVSEAFRRIGEIFLPFRADGMSDEKRQENEQRPSTEFDHDRNEMIDVRLIIDW